MKTRRLTTTQALVEYLANQQIASEADVDTLATPVASGSGETEPLFAGVFGIFGHGNVTCLADALYCARDRLPTWRGQNEQAMVLSAAAFAKAKRRRQVFACTSSIGPGATNMVTGAALAHANRLPVLLLAGDTFANRLPDPVLQQVEHFHDPTLTVNDSFRAVTRYWDRITRPSQLLASLPQAIATLLDAGHCGPAFLALPQDIQGEAFDYPEAFLQPTTHRIPRPRVDRTQLASAAQLLATARRPLLICGGGVHYSLATATLAAFATRHRIPVVETVAGRAALTHSHPHNFGAVGILGASAANALAAQADVVLAVGTRLQDFTTGSWSVFGVREDFRLITLNAARWDAHKHHALALVGDARDGLADLSAALNNWQGSEEWLAIAQQHRGVWEQTVDANIAAPQDNKTPLSYAHVVGAVNRAAAPGDLALTAAGGFPGELCMNWRAKAVGDFDCEFGYSCMGYEIAGGLGAKMANPAREVFVLVGDGSYLMMNSDILSAVMTQQKLVIAVCDNGGYAVINRLQNFKGAASFNNLFADCHNTTPVAVDFVAHAKSMGADGCEANTMPDLEAALQQARKSANTFVICVRIDAHQWTPNDVWWDVGMPQASAQDGVRAATATHEQGRAHQRPGI